MITIDGPAGAGKSTVARQLAARLGFRVVDTGAMYRALALSLADAGPGVEEDAAALRAHLARVDVHLEGDRVLLDGRDVTDAIRTRDVSALTSRITMLASVREKMTPLQRREAAGGGVILEGRDTGTVVCPDAEVKFYLDAQLDERARRRARELEDRGTPAGFETLKDEMALRDAQDATRALAPLRRPTDAIEVDTTALTVDEVVDRMLAEVERKCSTRR